MKRAPRPRFTVRTVVDVVALALTIFVAWFLWPSFLGGSTRFIVVAGNSMEPTYQSGELVVLDTDAEIEPGDIVVFQIPEGQPAAGQLVIHRMIGIRPDGTVITQGDNRDTEDSFTVTREDILGTPKLAVPHFGLLIGIFRMPIAIGVCAGLVCTLLLWPRPRPVQPPVLVGLSIDDEGWSSLTITPQAQRDAETWLESQLGQVA